MPEYAFDVTLNAVIRIRAKDEKFAREILEDFKEEFDIQKEIDIGVTLTAASVAGPEDGPPPHLFEVDGVTVEGGK